jgi:hypothetical protein
MEELMSDELQQACFDLARITKWSRKPVDAVKIQAFAEQIAAIAREQVSEPLGIDIPLITRAVRYLANAHAIPPMDENTQWFSEMLRAVLEIARPNTGIDEENKAFLRDMLDGIQRSLRD